MTSKFFVLRPLAIVDLPAPGNPVRHTISLATLKHLSNKLREIIIKIRLEKNGMRTFVAAEISNESVLNTITKIQSELDIDARPVSKQNMHFTLLFLGEISEDVSKKVQEALTTVEFSPIPINFTGVGVFPNAKFPRVLWVGINEDAAASLSELAKKVEAALAPLGFTSDKPFSPHVTIFRVKRRAGNISKELEKFKDYKIGDDTISEIKFKKSTLTPDGPIYSDLQVVIAKK